MTLPDSIIFPRRTEFEDLKDVDNYFQDLTFELTNMYEDLSKGINGDIRSDTQVQRSQWQPILKGTAVAGTFTYNHQIGWSLRKGLITDAWFDISWSASGAAAGNLYIELPYEVANTNQKPFSSAIQSSNIAYAGSTLHINAITNTFRGEIWQSGSGIATSNLAVAASGQLIGSIRYMGKSDET